MEKIIILGGGPAGQMLASGLQKKLKNGEAEVTVVNNTKYHFFTYKLHEVAAGTTTFNKVTLDIPTEMLTSDKITFRHDTVISVNQEEKTVQMENGVLNYDKLIVCIGGEAQTFNNPDVEKCAHFITNMENSGAISDKLHENFKTWNKTKDDALLTVICVGAGFTGLEFLGEVVFKRNELAQKYNIALEKIRIICVEASDKMLPAFQKKSLIYVKQFFEKNNVEILFNSRVEKIDENGINLQTGERIDAKLVVWAAGIRGSKVLNMMGFPEFTRDNRILVDEYLAVKNCPNVYVIGDASVVKSPSGEEYPPTAQIALQQGEYLAKVLVGHLRGQKSFAPFRYIYRGTLLSLGQHKASGEGFGIAVTGYIAHVLKVMTDIRYYFKVKGVALVLKMQFRK